MSRLRPAICYEPCVDGGGAVVRCHKEPGHEDEHGPGGELGALRWFLHNAAQDDELRDRAERRWHWLKKKEKP